MYNAVETPTLPKPQKVAGGTATKGRTRGAPKKPEGNPTSAGVSAGMGLAYERFLELPTAVVLSVMWVVGTVLLGACVLAAYAAVSALVGLLTGAF